MDKATDTAAPEANDGPMTEDTAVDWLLSPESPEPEEETAEAPAEPTQADDTEAEDDAPDDEAENTDDEDSDDADSDEDDDAEDDDEEEQPAERYTVKVDGEEKQVTLDELKRGYSGQAYIQQGMEKAKQFEKQLLEEKQTLQQERQVLMQAYEQANSTGFIPAPQPPARELLDQDPIAYMEAEADYRSNLQAYQQQQQQMQYLQQRNQQETQAEQRKRLQSEMEKLTTMIPEFGDAEKAPKLKERLVKNASEHYGYTADEVEQVDDARAIAVLNDAMAYRELMAGKQAAKQPREQAKAVTKPKGKAAVGKRQQAQKQMQKAQKTQSDDDWVNVLLNP